MIYICFKMTVRAVKVTFIYGYSILETILLKAEGNGLHLSYKHHINTCLPPSM